MIAIPGIALAGVAVSQHRQVKPKAVACGLTPASRTRW
jgi:hypothetical protein